MKSRMLFIALSSVLFFSCTSVIPKPEETGVGLVMTLSECDLGSSEEVFVAYDIMYDDGKSLRIDPTNEYSITRKVELGKHTITSIRLVNKANSSDLVHKMEVSIPFTVEEKKCTILPLKLVITSKTEQNMRTIYSNARPLNATDVLNAREYFYKIKNSVDWQIVN